MIEPATLDRVPFFKELNASARRELSLRGVLRRFAPEEALWRAGVEASSLFIVLEGEVRVVRASGGRQHVIHTEGPGGTLGEVPLFEGGSSPRLRLRRAGRSVWPSGVTPFRPRSRRIRSSPLSFFPA